MVDGHMLVDCRFGSLRFDAFFGFSLRRVLRMIVLRKRLATGGNAQQCRRENE